MRFFHPTPAFLPWVCERRSGRMVIEAGHGDGDLLRDLKSARVPVLGVDPRYTIFGEPIPVDLSSCVYPSEAEACPLVHTTPALILVCRPCHSAFPAAVARVMHSESELVYVGFRKNHSIDLPRCHVKALKLGVVGLDGERAYSVTARI